MKGVRGARSKDQRFLVDPRILHWFGQYAAARDGPFLDIGSGKGAILFQLPHPRTGVQRDERFKADLVNENILWGDWLQTPGPLPHRTVVGNLPFSRGVHHLLHIYRTCPHAQHVAVILQDEVARSFVQGGKLGFLMRSMYDVTYETVVDGKAFTPAVSVRAGVVSLVRKPLSEGVFDRISYHLHRLTSMRKYLKKTYPDIPVALAEKRMDELTMQEEDVLRGYFLVKDDNPPVSPL